MGESDTKDDLYLIAFTFWSKFPFYILLNCFSVKPGNYLFSHVDNVVKIVKIHFCQSLQTLLLNKLSSLALNSKGGVGQKSQSWFNVKFLLPQHEHRKLRFRAFIIKGLLKL